MNRDIFFSELAPNDLSLSHELGDRPSILVQTDLLLLALTALSLPLCNSISPSPNFHFWLSTFFLITSISLIMSFLPILINLKKTILNPLYLLQAFNLFKFIWLFIGNYLLLSQDSFCVSSDFCSLILIYFYIVNFIALGGTVLAYIYR